MQCSRRWSSRLAEPLQLAMDNGAKRALIPLENKRSFLKVTGAVVETSTRYFLATPRRPRSRHLGSIKLGLALLTSDSTPHEAIVGVLGSLLCMPRPAIGERLIGSIRRECLDT